MGGRTARYRVALRRLGARQVQGTASRWRATAPRRKPLGHWQRTGAHQKQAHLRVVSDPLGTQCRASSTPTPAQRSLQQMPRRAARSLRGALRSSLVAPCHWLQGRCWCCVGSDRLAQQLGKPHCFQHGQARLQAQADTRHWQPSQRRPRQDRQSAHPTPMAPNADAQWDLNGLRLQAWLHSQGMPLGQTVAVSRAGTLLQRHQGGRCVGSLLQRRPAQDSTQGSQAQLTLRQSWTQGTHARQQPALLRLDTQGSRGAGRRWAGHPSSHAATDQGMRHPSRPCHPQDARTLAAWGAHLLTHRAGVRSSPAWPRRRQDPTHHPQVAHGTGPLPSAPTHQLQHGRVHQHCGRPDGAREEGHLPSHGLLGPLQAAQPASPPTKHQQLRLELLEQKMVARTQAVWHRRWAGQ